MSTCLPNTHANTHTRRHASAAGITTIDTADIYGDHTVEAILGDAFQLDSSLAPKFRIITKCGRCGRVRQTLGTTARPWCIHPMVTACFHWLRACVGGWHNTGIKLKSRYGLKSYDSSSDHIVHSVEESLKALRCDSVDTVLVHRPDPLMDPSDVAAAFDGLRKGGLVRAFGVSNFTPSQCELLRATATDAVSINQVRFTPIGGGWLW